MCTFYLLFRVFGNRDKDIFSKKSLISKTEFSNLENAFLETGILNLTSNRLGTLKYGLSDKKSS